MKPTLQKKSNSTKPLSEATIIPKPQYKVTLEGVTFIVQFDVNINETKRGIKMRFHPMTENIDMRRLSDLADKIALVLQKQFTNVGLQVDRDVQVQDPTVIGFIVPLTSLAHFIMAKVIKGE